MGRRSRHKANTGDQKLYASRDSITTFTTNAPLDESSDTFQKRRELEQDEMLFQDADADARADEPVLYGANVEGVFDLGGNASDSSEQHDEDDSIMSEEDGSGSSSGNNNPLLSDSSASGSSSEEDDEIAQLRADIAEPSTADELLNWGKKKKSYYYGDTADLEIGQDEEEAYLEEEAAKEVLKARYADMEEGDFALDGAAAATVVGDSIVSSQYAAVQKRQGTTVESLADILSAVGPSSFDAVDQLILPSDAKQSLESLSVKEQHERITSAHPEFFPLINHFKTSIEELFQVILPVSEQLSKAENSEAVGTTSGGKEYLRHKKILLLNTAINLTSYLMLKNDENIDVRNHPIVARLSSCDVALTKLQENIEEPLNLTSQLHAVVQATSLMNDEDLSDDESETSDNEEVSKTIPDVNANEASDEGDLAQQVTESDDSSDDAAGLEVELRNETRFAVRPQDVIDSQKRKRERRVTNTVGRERFSADFGDDSDDDKATRASKGLSATMNTLTQKEKSAAKRVSNLSGEVTDEIKARQKESQVEDAFDLMDNLLGRASDEEGNEGSDFDNEVDGDEFYSAIKKRKQSKKNAKESMYKVAPKYPNIEETIAGERAVSKKILKNRGLVAHKPKINRNPRVKKREQYRKAIIRRKGAVRDVRTGEVDQYGGESTGIKSGISRSRKLGFK